MITVGIMGGGPTNMLPDMSLFKEKIDYWIGADRGALTLLNKGMKVDIAIGDFDSVNEVELSKIRQEARTFSRFPVEKDETDVELALQSAFERKPDRIILFGVTGGRMDHTLTNIQLLYKIIEHDITGKIVDKLNELELTLPGKHIVTRNSVYPNISFTPFTFQVKDLTLEGFYYPLANATIQMGSSLCISNKLISNNGTFSYDEGILLLIKSRD